MITDQKTPLAVKVEKFVVSRDQSLVLAFPMPNLPRVVEMGRATQRMPTLSPGKTSVPQVLIVLREAKAMAQAGQEVMMKGRDPEVGNPVRHEVQMAQNQAVV